jgi:streptogramin lyase
MKLFCRVLPLPIVFLCLVSFMTVGAGIAKGQSITFSPAEKPIVIPGGFAPFGNIASDPAGNLFFPIDKGTNIMTVGKVSPTGVFTVSSPLPANHSVGYVKTDRSGNLYVVDESTNQVLRITPAGASTIVATDTVFNFNDDFAIDGTGNIYVVDPNNKQVLKFASAGGKSALPLSPGLLLVVSLWTEMRMSTYRTIPITGSLRSLLPLCYLWSKAV